MMEQKSDQRNMDNVHLSPIEIKNLSVTYRTEPALWNIDLNFPEGKLIAIVGPNGAGKSTLIKAVMGLVPITAGKVNIYGNHIQNSETSWRMFHNVVLLIGIFPLMH